VRIGFALKYVTYFRITLLTQHFYYSEAKIATKSELTAIIKYVYVLLKALLYDALQATLSDV